MRTVPFPAVWPLLAVPAALAVLALLAGGCGSDAPTAFAPAAAVSVEPPVAALAQAWANAQRDQDHEALRATYADDYALNGMTAHEMAHAFLLPHGPDTRVTQAAYELVAPPEHHAHAAQDHEHHAVMVRLTLTGVVSAEALASLVGTVTEETHEHVHAHAAPVAPLQSDHEQETALPGVVTAHGRFDVVLELGHAAPGEPRITAQRIHYAEIRYGGGLTAPVLANVHAHPESVHPEEEVEVHGQFAMLPPGGVIHAAIGSHEPAEAEAEAGSFHVHVHAPDHEGAFLARVEAYGGDLQSRTGAITIAEREVSVTHADD